MIAGEDLASEILAGLDEEQARAVTADADTVVVIAGAGSGKTRVLTRRIAYRFATGAAPPERSLAVTFTRRAASELIQRLGALGIEGATAGTFHSIALRSLKRRLNSRAPKIAGSKAAILSRVAGKTFDSGSLAEIVREVDWAQARMIPPSRYVAAAAERETAIEHHTIASLYKKYEVEKSRRGVIDFEDMLRLVATAIEEDPRFAAVIRGMYRHIYVDEFQDVSPLQYRMLNALTSEESDLFIVGDPAQSIFSFTGADPGYLNGFAERRQGVELVRLTGNYRSTPEIIAVANSMPVAVEPAKLRATQPSGPVPEILRFEDEKAEAAGIAQLLRGQYETRHGWRSCAVLYRTAAQSLPIEAALREFSVPYTVRDGAFVQRPSVSAVLQNLRETDAAPGIPLTQLVEELVEAQECEGEDQANLDLLVALAEEYSAIAPGAMAEPSEFVEYVRQSRETPLSSKNCVSLLTLHSAKGLEFRTVIIAGCEDDLIPTYHARSHEEIEEERRLLYVGITRAQSRLVLTSSSSRTTSRGPAARSESSFLGDIRAKITTLRRQDMPSVDWRQEIAKQREAIGKTPPSP